MHTTKTYYLPLHYDPCDTKFLLLFSEDLYFFLVQKHKKYLNK